MSVTPRGHAFWLRTALPHAGGIGEQDAQLLASLDLLRQVHDQLLHEARDRVRQQRRRDKWKKTRQGRGDQR